MDAYWVTGDTGSALVKRKVPPEIRTRDQAEELLPERGTQGDSVRTYPGWPKWLEYECLPSDDPRVKFVFADAIGSFDAEFGAEILLSETAVAKLEPFLGGQAEFHLAKVASTPEPYYLLWIKSVVDAIDYERSILAPVEYLKRDDVVPLRIVQAVFKQEKIADRMLFRLSPGHLAMSSLRDYATDNFLELVKRLKISGFHFYRNHTERPLVPVKSARRAR
jgi:hypothetical protein